MTDENGIADSRLPEQLNSSEAPRPPSRRAKLRNEFEDQLIKTLVWLLIVIVPFLAVVVAHRVVPSLSVFVPMNDYCDKATASFWCAVWGGAGRPLVSPVVLIPTPSAASDIAAVKRDAFAVDITTISSYPLMRELLPDFWGGLRTAGINPAQPNNHGPRLDLRWPTSSSFFVKADNGDPDPDHPAARLDGTWVWLTLVPAIKIGDRTVAELGEVRAAGHVPVGSPQAEQAAEADAARTLGQVIGRRVDAWLDTHAGAQH